VCGIVGIISDETKTADIVESLKKLEYRGYDSSGIAFVKDGKIEVYKSVGKINALKNVIKDLLDERIEVGIAHTRWATHGQPNDINAHPHTDCTGKIAIVHNGIIENFRELRSMLEALWHKFKSDTDTEVIAHLIEEEYSGNLFEAVMKAIGKLDGAYAIGVIHSDHPDMIVAARKGSPLVIGIRGDMTILASDVTPIIRYTKDVIFLEDGDVALLKKGNVEVYRSSGEKVERKVQHINWDESAAEKGGYEHFMIKEIMEEPMVISSAITGRVKSGRVDIPEIKEIDFSKIRRINLVACGTSYHAALFFKYFVEFHTDLDVLVEVSSEFRYRKPHVDKDTLTIAISQSGETADTLESIRLAKRLGSRIIAITNVVGSTITRESDVSIMMNSGPEIGVAATKTYVAQLTVLLLLGLEIIEQRGFWAGRHEKIFDTLLRLPEVFSSILDSSNRIKEIAKDFKDYDHFMYIGRGYGYPTALEGALKLKEISYIHAEGYPAGELKHGPIALLDENFPVFAIVPQDSLYQKMKSNIMECRARNARIIALTTSENKDISQIADIILEVPKVPEELYPLVMSPVIQLFAYYMAVLKGHDPDKPRNLAKSVTVE